VINITNVITGSFWGIIVTEKLGVPDEYLSIFPFIKSAVVLFFFFMVMPHIKKLHFKLPMTIGFLGFVASQLILITAPVQGYLFLIVSVILEACSFAAVSPLVDQMVALTVDPRERARIQSILYVGIISLTTPFGWIAGALSERNKIYPFILNIALFTIGATLAYLAGNASQKKLALEKADIQ
jgi:MFS family permease